MGWNSICRSSASGARVPAQLADGGDIMKANRRDFIKATGIGVAGVYLGSSFSWWRGATASDASHGTLAEQITVICRRLAGHGWRALMLKVTSGEFDLSSPT